MLHTNNICLVHPAATHVKIHLKYEDILTIDYKAHRPIWYNNLMWKACKLIIMLVKPITAKLFILNFHPLEVVSRWRDPQLSSEWKLIKFDKMDVSDFEIVLIDVTFYLMLESWYLANKKVK